MPAALCLTAWFSAAAPAYKVILVSHTHAPPPLSATTAAPFTVLDFLLRAATHRTAPLGYAVHYAGSVYAHCRSAHLLDATAAARPRALLPGSLYCGFLTWFAIARATVAPALRFITWMPHIPTGSASSRRGFSRFCHPYHAVDLPWFH